MELEDAIDKLNDFKTIKILYGNTFAMHIEQLKSIQKAIKTVLQALENSVPKKKIEDKIKEYESKHTRDKVLYGTNTYNAEIQLLQELLEDK